MAKNKIYSPIQFDWLGDGIFTDHAEVKTVVYPPPIITWHCILRFVEDPPPLPLTVWVDRSCSVTSPHIGTASLILVQLSRKHLLCKWKMNALLLTSKFRVFISIILFVTPLLIYVSKTDDFMMMNDTHGRRLAVCKWIAWKQTNECVDSVNDGLIQETINIDIPSNSFNSRCFPAPQSPSPETKPYFLR